MMTTTDAILAAIDSAVADAGVSPDAMRHIPARDRRDALTDSIVAALAQALADDTMVSDSAPLTEVFGDPIHVYSRARALADGALVDAGPMAREAGIVHPVALTAAAWADMVAWDPADNARKGTVQDEDGRLWDVLWMLRAAIWRGGVRRAVFELYRVPREGRGRRPRLVRLVAVCGPGDDGEPVVTVMLPSED